MTTEQTAVSFSATLVASTTCAVGDALVYDTAASGWKVATSANRAAADARTQAIATQAYGGSVVGRVSFRNAGVLSAAVTGLATVSPGTRQLVRVSSAGRLERIASYTSGDDVVGYAEPDGRVHLHLGIPWDQISAAASSVTGRQYVFGDGALQGSAFYTAAAGGQPQIAADRSGGAATEGDVRHARDTSVFARALTSDRCVWSTLNAGVLFVGAPSQSAANAGKAWLNTFAIARYHASLRTSIDGSGGFGDIGAIGKGYDSVFGWDGGYMYPNVLLGTAPSTYSTTDIFGGGNGVVGVRTRTTAPTGTVPSGLAWIWFETDGTTTEFLYFKSPLGNVHNLIPRSRTTSSTSQSVLTVSGNDTYTYTGSGTATCTGFTAPPSGVPRVVTYVNNSSFTVTFDETEVGANGISCSEDVVDLPAACAVQFAYSHAISRWVPILGATLVNT